MKPKKPDKFERIVLAALKKNSSDVDFAVWLNAPDIAKLLRREYRWMAKMIKTMEKPPGEVADVLSRREILDKLTQRAK